MQRAVLPPPTLPYFTRMRLLGHRLYRLTSSMKNVNASTAPRPTMAKIHCPVDQSSNSASGVGVFGASVLSMGHPPVLGRRDDLDGLGADDVDDHHLRPRRQRVLERHRLVFRRPV